MLYTLRKAVALYTDEKDKWKALCQKCMKMDFSWNASADAYMALYNEVLNLDK